MREDNSEFDYQTTAYNRSYRMIAVRKQIRVVAGQLELNNLTRYSFYITNLREIPAETIVSYAN